MRCRRLRGGSPRDPAGVLLDDALHDGETESRAALAPREERLEDAIEIVAARSRAVHLRRGTRPTTVRRDRRAHAAMMHVIAGSECCMALSMRFSKTCRSRERSISSVGTSPYRIADLDLRAARGGAAALHRFVDDLGDARRARS